MRYEVTMTDGSRWRTDFAPGEPVRTPDGEVVASTFVARRWNGSIYVHVALVEANLVTILDLDCG